MANTDHYDEMQQTEASMARICHKYRTHGNPWYHEEMLSNHRQKKIHNKQFNWAMTCECQQCGILTSVDSDEPV